MEEKMNAVDAAMEHITDTAARAFGESAGFMIDILSAFTTSKGDVAIELELMNLDVYGMSTECVVRIPRQDMENFRLCVRDRNEVIDAVEQFFKN